MRSRFARQFYGSPNVGCAVSSRPPLKSARWRDLSPPGDRVDWSHIEDDICASPKPDEGAPASKPWVSRPFHAYASVTPKTCRIPAAAGPTRSDWGPSLRTLHDQQLMLECERFGHHRAN